MTSQASYSSKENNASAKKAYSRKKVIPDSIDRGIFWWLKSRVHPLRWATHNPAKSPSSDQLRKGLAGKTRSNGGANKISSYIVAKCRQTTERLYICSGEEKGFLWIDFDAHLWRQCLRDAQQAAWKVRKEFSQWGLKNQILTYPSSFQGVHAIIPVCFKNYDLQKVCDVYTLFQEGMGRFLHWHQSPVTMTTEIKGHPPHLRPDGSLYCGTLSRLPIEQEWGLELITYLMLVPEIPISLIQQFAVSLKANYPPIPILQPPSPVSILQQSHTQLSAQQQTQKPASLYNQQQSSPQPKQTTLNGLSSIKTDDLRSEPDSLKRQHQALMRLARNLKRLPTESEALNFIQQENLYTDDWQKNLSRRIKRVKGILRYISQNFDPQKAMGREINWQDMALALEHKRRYVESYYPNGINFLPKNPNKSGSLISPEHIAVFLHITEVCLNQSPNQDGSVPRSRFEAIWKELTQKGLTKTIWNRHYWLRLREFFVLQDLIEILDRQYGPQKAMRWQLGKSFPVFQKP